MSNPIREFRQRHGGTRKRAPAPPAPAAPERSFQGIPLSELAGIVTPKRHPIDKSMGEMTVLGPLGLDMPLEDILALHGDGQPTTSAGGEGDLGLVKVFRAAKWGGSPLTGQRFSDYMKRKYRTLRYGLIDVPPHKYQMRSASSAVQCVLEDLGVMERVGLSREFRASACWVDKRLTGTARDRARELGARGHILIDGQRLDLAALVRERVADPVERAALLWAVEAGRNNATGRLKSMKGSVAYYMRELQKPPVLAIDLRQSYEKAGEDIPVWTVDRAIRWALKILDADFRVRVGVEAGTLEQADMAALLASPTLGYHFTDAAMIGQNFGPFTVGAYLRNLVTLGTSEEEVLAEADFAIRDVMLYVQEQNDLARRLVSEMEITRFAAGFGAVIAHLDPAVADNSRLARALFKSDPFVKVVIVVNRRGNVAVLTDCDLDMSGVARQLLRQEPDCWTYDNRLEAVLNSGFAFDDQRPTRIPIGEIVALAEKAVFAEGFDPASYAFEKEAAEMPQEES